MDQPDWGHDSRSVAFSIETQDRYYHLIANAYWEPLTFQLPVLPDGFGPWKRIFDTFYEAPDDIRSGVSIPENVYQAQSRSVVVLNAVVE